VLPLPWRDQAAVWLAPSQVGLALRRRGWRTQAAQHRDATLEGGASAPAAALQALAALAAQATADGQATRAHTRIVLSNRFVPSALMPGATALRGAAERQLAAREVLRATHGDGVDNWALALDTRGGANPLAAGLEANWLATLRTTAQQAGLQAVSIRPLLAVAAAQAWPHIEGRSVWLLVTEADGAVLARIDTRGTWQSLRSLVLGTPTDADALSASIAVWLARCCLLDGLEPADLPLVYAPWQWASKDAGQSQADFAATVTNAGWQLQTVALSPDALWTSP